MVVKGVPVVLVGEDAEGLGDEVSASVDEGRHQRLLGVMVGAPTDPAVMAAASEMAAELWPWAGERPGGDGRGPARASEARRPARAAEAPGLLTRRPPG
jgi:hypothetical protein